MMMQRRVARRYAQALGQLAEERGILAEVERDLELVLSTIQDNDVFRRIWEHQRISAEKKRALVDTALGDKISPVTRHFLYLLLQKRRERILEAVAGEFRRLANEARNIVDVEVRTAKALGDEERELLSRRISEYIGKQVRLVEVTAPELLGGVVARVGDLVMDGSVLTRLERLREHLRGSRLQDEG